MDYQPNESFRQTNDASQSSLPVASLTLSLIGIFFCLVPFFGTICPSIAVTLSLLSRGGEMRTNGKSKIALILGVLGILISIAVTIACICYVVMHIDQQSVYDILNNSSYTDGNLL